MATATSTSLLEQIMQTQLSNYSKSLAAAGVPVLPPPVGSTPQAVAALAAFISAAAAASATTTHATLPVPVLSVPNAQQAKTSTHNNQQNLLSKPGSIDDSHKNVQDSPLGTSSTCITTTTTSQTPGVSAMPSTQQSLSSSSSSTSGGGRLNKFVRRLHEMLKAEQGSGIVEWRRGLLVLHSTHAFAKRILPKYFSTRNFKTFRRQLNYYGFVHVRSFSTTGTSTTALWVNRELAQTGSDDVSSVLMMRRVEPCESAKTVEGRRERKEQAIHTVEEDLGVNAKSLQIDHIRTLALRGADAMHGSSDDLLLNSNHEGAGLQQLGGTSNSNDVSGAVTLCGGGATKSTEGASGVMQRSRSPGGSVTSPAPPSLLPCSGSTPTPIPLEISCPRVSESSCSLATVSDTDSGSEASFPMTLGSSSTDTSDVDKTSAANLLLFLSKSVTGMND